MSRLARFRSAVSNEELRKLDIQVCRKVGNTSTKVEENEDIGLGLARLCKTLTALVNFPKHA